MSAKVREDLVLSHAVVTAEVEAQFDHVDIAQWLKTLPTHEYQRCAPPDHKAAGYTVDDDGTPMSINVEVIGTGLVVQQYRFEVAEPHYCKMVSLSDVLTPLGWTSTQVIWELRMEQLDGDRCRYTNTVTSHPPPRTFWSSSARMGRLSRKPQKPDRRRRGDTAGWRHLCMRRALPGGRPPTPQRQPRNDLSLPASREMCCLCSTRARYAWSLAVVPLRAYLVDQFMGCGQSCCV